MINYDIKEEFLYKKKMYSSIIDEAYTLAKANPQDPDLYHIVVTDLRPYYHQMTIVDQTRFNILEDLIKSSNPTCITKNKRFQPTLQSLPLEQEDKSKKTSLDKLKDAQTTLHETEDIARHTLQELEIQGDRIQRQKEVVQQVTSSLGYGNKLISRISSFWRN